jgi:hypothetical protein
VKKLVALAKKALTPKERVKVRDDLVITVTPAKKKEQR